MASNSLSLPVDIPWERWCVSNDMTDLVACDTDRPAHWQSSISVFKYVPEEDYQTYAARKITYIKVVCTIAGYQPKADEVIGVLSNLAGITVTGLQQDELERRLTSYRPCNEAIVQVTVAPPRDSRIPLDQYPYFMDFQPKKRELFEVGTETNEFMSRSLESLNIRKSGGTTNSQEVLDIDQGFNVSASVQGSAGGAGGGASFGYGQSGQWGTKQMGSAESGLARTTDESHERRETVSHTTQISQLRHLLDTYHQGTNRAVFFVQPRPNVLQEPSGFVTGPRPIEGIQEFFLIVNQPAGQPDFCLDVRLDTGHLYERPIMTYAYKSDNASLPFTNPTPLPEDTGLVPDGEESRVIVSDSALGGILWTYKATLKYKCFKRSLPQSVSYKPHEADYVIDVENIQGNPNNLNGFHVLPSTSVSGDAAYTVNTTPDGEMLTIKIDATSRACFPDPLTAVQQDVYIGPGIVAAAIADPVDFAAIALGGAPFILGKEVTTLVTAYANNAHPINQQTSSANVDVEVFLRSREPIKDTGKKERIFFVATRGLCCCAEGLALQVPGIVYEGLLPTEPTPPIKKDDDLPILRAPEDMTIKESDRMRSAMRQEMLRCLVSPRRTAAKPLTETHMFTALVLPTILQSPIARTSLRQPVTDSVPRNVSRRMSTPFRRGMKHITRLDFLTLNASALTQASGLDEATVHQLKLAMLKTILKPTAMPQQPKAAQQSQKTTRQARVTGRRNRRLRK